MVFRKPDITYCVVVQKMNIVALSVLFMFENPDSAKFASRKCCLDLYDIPFACFDSFLNCQFT
jgi:hypothetical protein